MPATRLGFFSRLLDLTSAAERYRLATEQIVCAERNGFDSAWVAQHHFVESEGGLPAPFVLLAHIAARTSRIKLGTGIVVLPLESPVRVAEDAAVLKMFELNPRDASEFFDSEELLAVVDAPDVIVLQA